MKKSTPHYFNSIAGNTMEMLTSIVRETIATETVIATEARKAFNTADLWNIHRNRRSFVQRRYIL